MKRMLIILLCLLVRITVVGSVLNPWYHGLAVTDAQKGDWETALKRMNTVLTTSYDDPYVLYDAGVAAYKTGQFEQAYTYFESCCQLSQGEPNLQERSYFNKGNVCVEQNNLQDALKAYESALTLNPTNKATQHNLNKVKEMLEHQKKQEDNKQKNDTDQDQKKEQQDDQQSKNNDQNNNDNKSDTQKNNKRNEKNEEMSNDTQQDKKDGGDQSDSTDHENNNRPSSQEQKNGKEQKGDNNQKEDQKKDSNNAPDNGTGDKQNQDVSQGGDTRDARGDKEAQKKQSDRKKSQQEKRDSQQSGAADKDKEKDAGGLDKEHENQAALLNEQAVAAAQKNDDLFDTQHAWMAQLLTQQENADQEANKKMVKKAIRSTVADNNGYNCW